jgi:hypothetical protein
VPPGADVSPAHPGQDGKVDRQVAGGIARFGLGASNEQDKDFADGIVRFSLGASEH